MWVFEQRYVALLSDLFARAADDPTFGILAIRRGHEVGSGNARELYEIGCQAQVSELTPWPSPQGSLYSIRAVGLRRFRLDSIEIKGGRPYLVGNVTFLDDPLAPAGPGPAEDLRRTMAAIRRELDRYRELVGKPLVELPDEPVALAYRAADAMVLELTARQKLLETDSLPELLGLVLGTLRFETSALRRFRAVPQRADPSLAQLS